MLIKPQKQKKPWRIDELQQQGVARRAEAPPSYRHWWPSRVVSQHSVSQSVSPSFAPRPTLSTSVARTSCCRMMPVKRSPSSEVPLLRITTLAPRGVTCASQREEEGVEGGRGATLRGRRKKRGGCARPRQMPPRKSEGGPGWLTPQDGARACVKQGRARP